MKQSNLHFLSDTPCSLFISGQMVGDIDNISTFYIDIISYSQSLIVSADPLNETEEKFLPTTFKVVNANNKVHVSSPEITVVPFVNNNCDILISLKKAQPVKPSINVFNKTINNKNVLITNSNNSVISIFNKQIELFSCTCESLSDINCTNFDNYVCISGKNKKGVFLLIYNMDDNTVLLKDTFLTVEVNEKNIKALKPLNNFFKHGIVYNFNAETKKVDNYTVFIKNSKVQVESSLVPYAFLEAIKACDFLTAKTFLSEELINTSNEKLEQYFGNIVSIFFNSYFFEPNQVNYTILNKDKFRNFTFTIVDNKICEIDENEV